MGKHLYQLLAGQKDQSLTLAARLANMSKLYCASKCAKCQCPQFLLQLKNTCERSEFFRMSLYFCIDLVAAVPRNSISQLSFLCFSMAHENVLTIPAGPRGGMKCEYRLCAAHSFLLYARTKADRSLERDHKLLVTCWVNIP